MKDFHILNAVKVLVKQEWEDDDGQVFIYIVVTESEKREVISD